MTGPIVLPEDVVIVSVRELSSAVRQKLDAPDESFAISRPRVRATSKILDGDAVELLQTFRAPKRIVDAVVVYSRMHELDPQVTLEDALPFLEECIKARFLVPLDSQAAQSAQNALKPGDTVDHWEVVRRIRVLDDSELYRVVQRHGGDATGALKIGSPDAPDVAHGMLRREAAVLQHLDGGASPRLLHQGSWQGRPYLITEWRSGASPEIVAAQRREHPRALLRLCLRILDAYAEIHDRGVLHVDVHPGNVLVDRNDAVTILDFGLAWFAEGDVPHRRAAHGGVGFFFEPEYAAAALAELAPRPPTPAGEQYRIAALLYFLLTGDHYLDFSLEADASLRQIVRDHPLPFRRRSTPSWPGVEAALLRALSKKPNDRFASVQDLAAALRKELSDGDEHDIHRGNRTDGGVPPAGLRLLDSVLQRVALSGPLLDAGPDEGPVCSIFYGAAGIAYALYRVACVRDDPAALALADAWITSALRRMDEEQAFSDPHLGLTEERIGSASPYHTASGMYCVAALIQAARNETSSLDETLGAFVAASRGASGGHLDLTLGRAGTLLAAALLLDALSDRGEPATKAVFELGSETLTALWSALDDCEPIPQCARINYAGMAHGWAGFLYATLRWCRTSGGDVPPSLPRRLDELAECAQPAGRGVRWPWMVSGDKSKLPAESMAGWCNGSAGYVFLWTLAHETTGHDRYLALAEGAAWDAWDAVRTPYDLCCGLAGRAYGLINLYKHTGDASWVARARELATAAATAAPSHYPNSLYKGQLGVALLALDSGTPGRSSMPFFEEEGWPPSERVTVS